MTSRLLPPPFMIGETYRDRIGEYIVTSTDGEYVHFDRPDGRKGREKARTKADIYRNIMIETNTRLASRQRAEFDIGYRSTKSGILEEMYWFIAEIIEEQSKLTTDYILHDSIADALTKHEYGGPLLKQRSERDPDGMSAEWFASDYVAFYSKEWTEGRPRHADRFQRTKIRSKWAYRVRL
jgi:hypothetical protein